MAPGSVVGCVEDTLDIWVVVRFHFCTHEVNWMISNFPVGFLLLVFWVPWAHFFLIFWGLGTRSAIHRFSGGALEVLRLRDHGQVRVTWRARYLRSLITDC